MQVKFMKRAMVLLLAASIISYAGCRRSVTPATPQETPEETTKASAEETADASPSDALTAAEGPGTAPVGAKDLFSAIKDLVALLSSGPLTADEVIGKVGTIAEHYSSNALLKPHDPLFSGANLVRAIDLKTAKPQDIPAALILTPAEPPTVKALAEAFGPYKKIPPMEKLHTKIIFYLDMPEQPYTVALIASIKDDLVEEITLRRDQRLK